MINRLSHVELAVTDLGRARAFYCDELGLVPYVETADALWLRAPEEFDVWVSKHYAQRGRRAGSKALGITEDAWRYRLTNADRKLKQLLRKEAA